MKCMVSDFVSRVFEIAMESSVEMKRRWSSTEVAVPHFHQKIHKWMKVRCNVNFLLVKMSDPAVSNIRRPTKNIACAVVPHLERTESLRIRKSNCSKLLRCNIERVAFDIAPTLWLLTTFHLFSQCSTHKFDKCKITVCLVRSHQNFVQRKSLYPHQVTSCTKHWLRQTKNQTKIQMMSLDRPWR